MNIKSGLAVILGLALLAGGLPARAAENTIALSVNAAEQTARFDAHMLGSNVGMWEWGGYYPQPDQRLVNAIRGAGLKLLRFPGGTEADLSVFDRTNTLEWHQTSGAYTRVLRADFLDAFITLCRQTGADPLIVVNARIEDAAMAADIVRYCNVEKGYGVRYFEIGNEPELYSGDYRLTAEQYSERYAAYAAAMRAVDPSIQLLGSASSQPIYREQWVGKLLETNGNTVSAATIHWYPMVGEQATPSHPCYPSVEHLLHYDAQANGYAGNEWHQNGAISYAELFVKTAENSLTALRDRYAANARIGLTELSPVTGGDNGAGLSDTAANALWFADVLGRLASNGVSFVTQFLLQGDQEYAMVDGYSAEQPFQLRPVWYAYVMYQRYFGDLLYASASEDEQKLTIWASGDSGDSSKLKLMVVNKTADEDLDAVIRLDGFTPLSREGELYTLSADSITAAEMQINGVSAAADNSLGEIAPQRLTGVSETIAHRFPAHSVTCITLNGYYGAEPSLDTVEQGIAVSPATEDFDRFAADGTLPEGWKGKDASVVSDGADGGYLLLDCRDNSGASFSFPNRIYFGREGMTEAVVGGTLSTREKSDYALYKDKYFQVLDSAGNVIATFCINVDGWLQFAEGGQSPVSIDDGSKQGICLAADQTVTFRLVYDLPARTYRLELQTADGWATASYYGSWREINQIAVPETTAALGGVRLEYSSGSSANNTICLDDFCYPVLKDIQPPAWENAELTAGDITQATAGFAWPAALDNVGVTGYVFYIDGAEAARVPPVTLQYTPQALQPGRLYRMGVAAVDRAGNESERLEMWFALPEEGHGIAYLSPVALYQSEGAAEGAVKLQNTALEPASVTLVIAAYQNQTLLDVQMAEVVCEAGFTGWKSVRLSTAGLQPDTTIRSYVLKDMHSLRPKLPRAEQQLAKLEYAS